ncbi:MAG: type toxin-antitoxin system death-on-curing family toxin [Proteobacteria bacterium]|nr:type toxin-antitoxin system death-on-curing family toxin [Pseudomonadota bacterium]
MDNLPKNIRDMYFRDRATIPNDSDVSNCRINYSDILKGYYYIVDYFTQSSEHGDESILPGLRDKNLLVSATHRQTTMFAGIDKWDNDFEKAASLFFGLVKNHAFFDGNKRIALLMLLLYLTRINRWPDCSQRDFENLTVSTAGSNILNDFKSSKLFDKTDPDFEIRFIADFIKKRTRQVSTSYRSITFRELDSILRKYGFHLDDKNANKIGIYKQEVSKTWFGIGKDKISNTRIGNIGFPGMSKQVSKGDLKQVRELTGLTVKNGYDSDIFYGKTESIYRLINDFEGPLRRLKDK